MDLSRLNLWSPCVIVISNLTKARRVQDYQKLSLSYTVRAHHTPDGARVSRGLRGAEHPTARDGPRASHQHHTSKRMPHTLAAMVSCNHISEGYSVDSSSAMSRASWEADRGPVWPLATRPCRSSIIFPLPGPPATMKRGVSATGKLPLGRTASSSSGSSSTKICLLLSDGAVCEVSAQ